MAKQMKYDIHAHKIDGHNGKIVIGIPRERVFIPTWVDIRDNLLMHLERSGRAGGLYQQEGHRVDRNRDAICEWFMEQPSKPEWLVMLDTDMDHPVNAPQRLTAWEKPIVGALYFHRGPRHDPFAFKRMGRYPDKYGRKQMQWMSLRDKVYDFLMANNVPMQDGHIVLEQPIGNPLIEVDAVATGCMAIHRSVLETMKPPWFEYRPLGNSEDLVFCDEAKYDYGIPIYCDIGLIIGHYNWVAMGHGQFRTIYRAHGFNTATYTTDRAINLVSEFFKISKEEANAKIGDANAHMVGPYWNKVQPKTEQEVADFYTDPKTGELYILELLYWNSSKAFNQLREALIPYREKTIVEIGSGIGTVALQLSLQNNHVVALEPNPVLFEFAKMRIGKIEQDLVHKRGSLILEKPDYLHGLENESVDIVCAFDVFEHLTPDGIKKYLSEAFRVLRPTGQLLYHNNFKQQDIYPMHYDYTEEWPEWLQEAGFQHVTDFEAVKLPANGV